jgi:Ca-activated chloride channel family protein
MAVENYLRPADETIPLHAPLALENGTDPTVTIEDVPNLESPSAEVAAAVQDVFFNTKKPATIVLVVDTSGSMSGEKIKGAAEGTSNFINNIHPRDEVYVIGFADDPYPVGQGGLCSEVCEPLAQAANGLIADGGTSLYDSICEAASLIDTLTAEHETEDDPHLPGIIVLSDGQDTSSERSESQMFNCLPSGESVEGLKVHTIAYGEDADQDLLCRIANRTNGKCYEGDAADIEGIYEQIAAFQ